MPKKAMESLTESMFYVLMALMRRPMCGIEAVRFVSDKTAGRISIGPATLYTLLGKFEKEGLIAETSVLGCKRYYQITPAGKAAYTAECTRLQLCLQNAAAAAQGAFAPAALLGKELDDHDQSTLQNPLAAHPLPTV